MHRGIDTRDGGSVWVNSGLDAGPDYSSCIPIDFEHHSLILAGTRSGLICVNAAVAPWPGRTAGPPTTSRIVPLRCIRMGTCSGLPDSAEAAFAFVCEPSINILPQTSPGPRRLLSAITEATSFTRLHLR